MKLEAFFEKFDQFADAPDAVEKIRGLLLHLAVTGRLSEPKAGDAPVSELLDALSDAKVRRSKTGRRGSAAPVPSESVIGRPVDTPAHWAWVPLHEIGSMSGGMTPSKNKSVFWDGDVNWFSSKDIKTDELIESELKVTREATEATGLQVYSPGCLVMVARSGILKRTFPVSILRVEGTVNQDLKVLLPFVGGIERYLQIMLRGMTDFILTSLVKTGMTVQSLKYEEFEAQSFPLPPLAEQKRIVAKVDELMALCDRLEAQQQERETRQAALARASLARFAQAPIPANLHYLFHPSYTVTPADLRKAILSLAVRGKLVPQDLADESDEPSSGIEVPFDLPRSWAWKPLGTIGTCRTGKTPPTGEPANYGGGIPFIGPGQITPAGDIIRSDKSITEFGLSNSTEAKEDDILMVCIGGSIGKAAICRETLGFNQQINSIRVESDLPMFVFTALTSSYFQEQVLAKASGSATPIINKGKWEQILVPLPPLAEQRRIVAKVEQLMALVDELEAQLAKSRATGEHLLDAIVAELAGASRERRAPARQVVTDGAEVGDAEEVAHATPGAGSAQPSRAGARRSQRASSSPDNTDATTRLAALLREKGNLSNSEAQAATGLDPATIRTHLQALVAAGRARTEGQRRGMRYLATTP